MHWDTLLPKELSTSCSWAGWSEVAISMQTALPEVVPFTHHLKAHFGLSFYLVIMCDFQCWWAILFLEKFLCSPNCSAYSQFSVAILPCSDLRKAHLYLIEKYMPDKRIGIFIHFYISVIHLAFFCRENFSSELETSLANDRN